jgi:hypothetical protein
MDMKCRILNGTLLHQPPTVTLWTNFGVRTYYESCGVSWELNMISCISPSPVLDLFIINWCWIWGQEGREVWWLSHGLLLIWTSTIRIAIQMFMKGQGKVVVEHQPTKSVALGPQANYTDWATTTCRRNLVSTFVDTWGVEWSAQRIPHLSFLDHSRYFFFQVAPQLSSRGWVDSVPDTLLLRKSGSAGNRTRDLWASSQELWPLDHRGGPTNPSQPINGPGVTVLNTAALFSVVTGARRFWLGLLKRRFRRCSSWATSQSARPQTRCGTKGSSPCCWQWRVGSNSRSSRKDYR